MAVALACASLLVRSRSVLEVRLTFARAGDEEGAILSEDVATLLPERTRFGVFGDGGSGRPAGLEGFLKAGKGVFLSADRVRLCGVACLLLFLSSPVVPLCMAA